MILCCAFSGLRYQMSGARIRDNFVRVQLGLVDGCASCANENAIILIGIQNWLEVVNCRNRDIESKKGGAIMKIKGELQTLLIIGICVLSFVVTEIATLQFLQLTSMRKLLPSADNTRSG